MSILTGRRFEAQTSQSRSERDAAPPTGPVTNCKLVKVSAASKGALSPKKGAFEKLVL